MKLLLIATLAASAFASETCQDNPDFTDLDIPGAYALGHAQLGEGPWGDGCAYWAGYGSRSGEVIGTFMGSSDVTTDPLGEDIPVAMLFGGEAHFDIHGDGAAFDNGAAEAGGFWDSQTFYNAAWYTGMKENCPETFEQCETPWYIDETTSFDGATLLPDYGVCRTSNEAYVTEAGGGEGDTCSQSLVDAGFCAIPSDNSYKPASTKLCVHPDTGVQDCYDACVADQTCGCFSVTVSDPSAGGSASGCTEHANAYCNLYPRTDYDGNVLTWDKANSGPVNFFNMRSFAMAAREVTCMDCRTSGDRRSRKMARKTRKLLFASVPDEHGDHMECCEGTDVDR